MAGLAAAYGAAFGLLPIGWIILNVIFLYQLTSEKGDFEILRRSISAISDDRRLQVLFIAFCLGAFFEGAAGFGTPVAVTAAMLIGLGFPPLAASGLSLIANTAPVAFGALGTPIIALSAVTGLDLHELSAMVGRQLPFFSVIVPFWLVAAFAGFRRDDGDMAADPRCGAVVRHTPVPRFELSWTLARRHRRGHRLDGIAGAVSQGVAPREPDDRHAEPDGSEADEPGRGAGCA